MRIKKGVELGMGTLKNKVYLVDRFRDGGFGLGRLERRLDALHQLGISEQWQRNSMQKKDRAYRSARKSGHWKSSNAWEALPIDGRHGRRNRQSRARLDRLLLIVQTARSGWSAVTLDGAQSTHRLPRKRHRAPERGEWLILDRVEHGARDNERAATLPPRGRVRKGQNANLWGI